jgi:hypothetical protein
MTQIVNMDGCILEYLGEVNLSDYMLCPSTTQASRMQNPSAKNEKRWYGKSPEGNPLKELKRYECSTSQPRQTDLASSDVLKERRKTRYSREKREAMALARTASNGDRLSGTTSSRDGTSPRDTTPSIEEAFVPSAMETSSHCPQLNSWRNTPTVPSPLNGNLADKKRCLYCPQKPPRGKTLCDDCFVRYS